MNRSWLFPKFFSIFLLLLGKHFWILFSSIQSINKWARTHHNACWVSRCWSCNIIIIKVLILISTFSFYLNVLKFNPNNLMTWIDTTWAIIWLQFESCFALSQFSSLRAMFSCSLFVLFHYVPFFKDNKLNVMYSENFSREQPIFLNVFEEKQLFRAGSKTGPTKYRFQLLLV